jgi:hypothetical protein
MTSFLTTTYTEIPGKGKNPPSFEAGASGYRVAPGNAVAFGDRTYEVAADGSIRRPGRSRMPKKLKRKVRAALKAEIS